MQEIRFHGRGGQGTVVASILLAKAYFSAGYYVQTFPVFGVERRGAPVESYLRLDERKILLRCNVYTPDHAVVQDAKLLDSVDVTTGLKPGGWILVNAPGQPANLDPFSGFNLASVDATGIAIENGLGTRTLAATRKPRAGAPGARSLDRRLPCESGRRGLSCLFGRPEAAQVPLIRGIDDH